MRAIIRDLSLFTSSTIAWLARFDFPVDASGPLSSPYTENGHDLTLVQVDGQLSISSGNLINTQQATPVYGDLGWYSEPFARVIGRSILYQLTRTGGAANKEILLGWGSAINLLTTTLRHGLYFAGANIQNWVDGGASTTLLSTGVTDATSYQIRVWMRSSGYAAAIKGGSFTNWRLLTVIDSVNTTPMYGTLDIYNATMTESFVDFQDLGGVFATDYGFATFTDTTLASGDAFTGTGDALKRYEFTVSGTPSAGDEIALYFRGNATDGSKIMVKRNVGNTAWDFQYRKVAAGVESTPVGWTDVTGVGTPNAIEVYCEGSVLFFNTRAAAVWVKRGATVTHNYLNTNTDMSIVAAAGTTLTRVTDFPLTGAVYNTLDRA